MKKLNSLLWIGTCTAIGSALGSMANPRKPKCGMVIGAVAGLAAGAVVNALYEKQAENNGKIKYYSASLPLYDESDGVGYI